MSASDALHHLFLILFFLPFRLLSTLCSFSHHLLLLLRFPCAGFLARSGAHSASTCSLFASGRRGHTRKVGGSF
uniref:Putative secreted protein n=1 Tax=Ixodes ricinus TaxID=34613 RepID=A0A147BRX7_IXORI